MDARRRDLYFEGGLFGVGGVFRLLDFWKKVEKLRLGYVAPAGPAGFRFGSSRLHPNEPNRLNRSVENSEFYTDLSRRFRASDAGRLHPNEGPKTHRQHRPGH